MQVLSTGLYEAACLNAEIDPFLLDNRHFEEMLNIVQNILDLGILLQLRLEAPDK